MASLDPSVPPPDSAPPPPAAGTSRTLAPGLWVTALIGAICWIFAIWIGPWIAPGPGGDDLAISDHESVLDPVQSVLALSVPDGMTRETPPPTVIQRVTIKRGDTLMGVLTRSRITRDEAHAAVVALRKVFNPRDLVGGTKLELSFQPLTSEKNAATSFRGLEFMPSIERTVGISRTWDNRFEAYVSKNKLSHEQIYASGSITTSLYVDAMKTGVPAPVIVEMIRAMSFDVDFQRDIKSGDRFNVLYDRIKDATGNVVGSGDILHTALTLSGKELSIYRFRMDDGTWDYFNSKGQSTRKALMRTPIDGARLSSRFGMRRHPILGYTKVHKGIDFAAPRGTAIMAAGRGVVVDARWNGGYGRYIRIRHNATYTTAYAHLSRFAKGLRRGTRVAQGQVIGYVGNTGRSTGPHLHYEVLRNNRQVNPLSVKLPTGRALRGAERKRYLAAKAEIKAALARLAPLATARP